jgi:hypothetical protein
MKDKIFLELFILVYSLDNSIYQNAKICAEDLNTG